MVIDHVGIVVRSLDEGIRQWQELFGYQRCSAIVTNSRQQVDVVFLAKPDSITVKLISPSSPESGVALAARRGGGLHHLCFRCQDMGAQLEVLQRQGARLLVPPQPGEAFKNRDIAFLLLNNTLNIELIATTEKEGWMGRS